MGDGFVPTLRGTRGVGVSVRKRLDVLMVERGLAESRSQAQAMVLAGLVHGYEKAGTQVDESIDITVDRQPRFVSRGGEKLVHALEAFRVDPATRDCLDVGASTGGFTDCLLQMGARRVIALDVGYGQLHPKVRSDPRVAVLERTNARHVSELPFAPDLVVCDVSFISARTVLAAVLPLARPGWDAVVLVKPQFEVGRDDAPKGVVRDPEVRRAAVRGVAEAVKAWGGAVTGVVDSGLPGPKGNRETFLHLVNKPTVRSADDIDRWIDDAIR
jgi:23S rRNA (cytidine1920-2'-O)/16S rRNA (cytidine1409-2'-O)-methyltransferase